MAYDCDASDDQQVDVLFAKHVDHLWGGGLTAQQVVDMFANSVGGNTVFNFGGGDVLTVVGIANPDNLVDDIGIV